MATRRKLLVGASASLAALATPTGGSAPAPALSPIMREASRLAALDKMAAGFDANDQIEKSDAMTAQALEVAVAIPDNPPEVLADAVILLMAAASLIRVDDFYPDGSHGHERGEIMVRRVMHFLADMAGLDLTDYGGNFFLPGHEEEALMGTVAEATLRFNWITEAKARERRDEYQQELQRLHLRSRYTEEERSRVIRLVEEASKKWASIPDDDPRFDAGRALLERSGLGGAT